MYKGNRSMRACACFKPPPSSTKRAIRPISLETLHVWPAIFPALSSATKLRFWEYEWLLQLSRNVPNQTYYMIRVGVERNSPNVETKPEELTGDIHSSRFALDEGKSMGARARVL
jgi:hypothetical protein